MLQSILSQQLVVAANSTPAFVSTTAGKRPGSLARRSPSAGAQDAQQNNCPPANVANSSSCGAQRTASPTNGLVTRQTAPSSSNSQFAGSDEEDTNDKDGRAESSCALAESSNEDAVIGADADADADVQVKEEPAADFSAVEEDDFCDGESTRGGATGDESVGHSDSDSELRMTMAMNSDRCRRESSLLPLLAQHLAAPNLLSASAKLRAAASQAQSFGSLAASADGPLMVQTMLGQPATPPDMGPASMGLSSDASSVELGT